ncbi:MAG: hypothetical protein IJ553_03650 [Alloprevotella sp.]|nr:hypothetical protein [Alloprevotella sp.]
MWLKIFMISVSILLVAFAFLAIRVWFGKDFVKTHIEDNKSLRSKGITCYMQMERKERRKQSSVRE